MTTVAVTGAASVFGPAVLHRLAGDPAVSRVIAVDVVEPQMPPGKVEFRTADVRDPLLDVALRDAEVVVNLAMTPGPIADEDTMRAVNVSGTRHVLAAAEAVSVRQIVHVSSGVVYGAHEGAPIPLSEDVEQRAEPDFPWAHQHVVAEQLIDEWHRAHPDVDVTVLRPALVLGAGVDTALTRHLEQPVLPFIKGSEPPLQVVSIDDLADAIAFAVARRLRGAFNVASDGWIPSSEVCHILGHVRVHVPEMVAEAGASLLWSRKLVAAPPGALHYLMEPWVLSTERLREAGWSASSSNREVLRAFADEHRAWISLGTWRARRAHLVLAVFALQVTGFVVTLIGWRSLRRRRRRQREVP